MNCLRDSRDKQGFDTAFKWQREFYQNSNTEAFYKKFFKSFNEKRKLDDQTDFLTAELTGLSEFCRWMLQLADGKVQVKDYFETLAPSVSRLVNHQQMTIDQILSLTQKKYTSPDELVEGTIQELAKSISSWGIEPRLKGDNWNSDDFEWPRNFYNSQGMDCEKFIEESKKIIGPDGVGTLKSDDIYKWLTVMHYLSYTLAAMIMPGLLDVVQDSDVNSDTSFTTVGVDIAGLFVDYLDSLDKLKPYSERYEK